MIIPTHRIIGQNIYKSMLLNTGIQLNERALIIGSVLPDIMPKYIKQKHFFSVSYDYILEMIEKLYNDSQNMSLKEFSTRLGVITHYISDFFCTPHNDRAYYHNHLKEHMQFESKLHFLFKNQKEVKKISIPKISGIDYKNIKAIIDQLHFDYEKRGVSLENDLNSTLNAVNIISSLIITHCFEEFEIPAFAA